VQSADFITYRVLTLQQPYASLIALGHKRIETRGWKTPYRGEILIHAGMVVKSMPLCREPFFRQVLQPDDRLPLGAIIARAQLVDIKPVEELELSEQERAFGDYAPGRYGWLLEEVQPLSHPVMAGGALGLWRFKDQEHYMEQNPWRPADFCYVSVGKYANP